jgi:hypothetical protein
VQGTEHDVAFFLALGYAPDFTRTVCKNQHGMLAFLGYCSPSVAPKMFKKQCGMLAFFMVFSSIWASFSVPGVPLELPRPL